MRGNFQMEAGATSERVSARNRQFQCGNRGGGGGGREANPIEGAPDIQTGQAEASVAIGLRGELQDALDVGIFLTAEIAFDLHDGVADQAAADGGRLFGESGRAEFNASVARDESGGGEIVDVGPPPAFFVVREGSQVGERFGDAWIPVAGELRQERAADAIAGKAGIAVAGVFTPGDAARAQEGFDVGAGDLDEWADDGRSFQSRFRVSTCGHRSASDR